MEFFAGLVTPAEVFGEERRGLVLSVVQLLHNKADLAPPSMPGGL